MFDLKFLTLVLLILAGCASAPRSSETTTPPLLSKAELAERYADKLREAIPSASVTVGPNGVSVLDADLNYIWHPDNAHLEYQRSSETLEEVLDRHIKTALEQKSVGYAHTSETVLACVRAEIPVPVTDDPRQRLAFKPIAGDLRQYFCGDSVAGISVLNEGYVDALRQQDRAFDAKIISNIVKLSGPIEYNPTASMTLVTSGGNYEAGLLLVPEVWSELETRHGDDMAFTVPARDLLLVAATSDTNAIARMRSTAKDFYESSAYAISPLVYRYYNGEISVLAQ